MAVPYWVQDAVFYQIFPDRFANGDPRNDPPNVRPWDAPPTITGFHGGDLRGVISRLDYLLDLGINAIYFNPIFQSASTHRYNASDYYRIDPKLGDSRDFDALLDAAHRVGIRVILDGVFNHCGRGFFAFNDLLENQEHSPYKDWFTVYNYPIDAYSPGDAHDYSAWWKFKSLPKFNTSNPAVRRYLLGVGRHWIERGIDGWRLDVPNEIDDDSFWAEFRENVRSVNPDAYLIGEIWDVNPRWANDTHFDGLMHYPLRTSLLGYLNGKVTAPQFADSIDYLLAAYPRENTHAMYLTLGTHDTERVFTLCGEDLNKVKLAFLFQFSYPGVPAVYYGDEVGIPGGKDPDCRRTFPWDSTQWKPGLRPFVQKVIDLRKRLPELRRGEYRRLTCDPARSVVVFVRSLGSEHVVVAINAGSTRRTVKIPVADLGWADGRIVRNLLDGEEYIVSGESLAVTVPPVNGLWLK